MRSNQQLVSNQQTQNKTNMTNMKKRAQLSPDTLPLISFKLMLEVAACPRW